MSHMVEDLKALLLAGKSLLSGKVDEAKAQFDVVLTRPFDEAAKQLEISEYKLRISKLRLAGLDSVKLVPHANRYLLARSTAEALEPFAEDPGRDRSKYPCHSGLTTADKCGRCSKASNAWKVMQEAKAVCKEYEDEKWVIFSESEYVDGDAGFWSNEDGWSGPTGATVFNSEELASFTLPVGVECIWMKESVMLEHFSADRPSPKF